MKRNYSGCQVHGSRFRVGYFALFILFEIVDLPARALTSICFFNYTLNILNNLFFPYISGLAWQAGESTSGSPAMRDSSGLLVDIFDSLGDMFSSGVIRFKVHSWLPYLHTGLCSSFSNPWPRPGLALLFIESLGAVFRRTVLKRTLRRTRAGLNREPRNFEPE